MSRLAIICVLGTLAACSPSSATPPTSGACGGSLAEYCALGNGRCPTFAEAVARRVQLCPQATWEVQANECAGSYRSVSWRDFVLGGGQEFFDGDGRLVAATIWADYPAYCGRTSFDQKFGAPPACAGEPVRTPLCIRCHRSPEHPRRHRQHVDRPAAQGRAAGLRARSS